MSWSTSELRVRLAPWNQFKPFSKIFYWPFQGGTSFVENLYCFFWLVFVKPSSVYLIFVVTCWERADLLALVCGVWLWFCHFPIGILGQVWYLIVSIPYLYTLTYFDYQSCFVCTAWQPLKVSPQFHLMLLLFQSSVLCVQSPSIIPVPGYPLLHVLYRI